MLTIGREKKRKGFKTETQEVLSTYTKRGKDAQIQNRGTRGPEHLYEKSERGRDFKQRPRRSFAAIGREGKGNGLLRRS